MAEILAKIVLGVEVGLGGNGLPESAISRSINTGRKHAPHSPADKGYTFGSSKKTILVTYL